MELNLHIDNHQRARHWLLANFHKSRYAVYPDNITIYCMSIEENDRLTDELSFREGDILDRVTLDDDIIFFRP